jgi:hypothetical protein
MRRWYDFEVGRGAEQAGDRDRRRCSSRTFILPSTCAAEVRLHSGALPIVLALVLVAAAGVLAFLGFHSALSTSAHGLTFRPSMAAVSTLIGSSRLTGEGRFIFLGEQVPDRVVDRLRIELREQPGGQWDPRLLPATGPVDLFAVTEPRLLWLTDVASPRTRCRTRSGIAPAPLLGKPQLEPGGDANLSGDLLPSPPPDY